MRTKLISICLILLLLTVAIYWQVVDHQFVLYDDEDYVLINSRLRLGFTFENVYWFLTNYYASNWHPITWFSHILDVKLFGIDPTGHHLVSVALHGINSILLFLFLHRFTGSLWRSATVAALFAVHPLNVESVAWIAERKNVLSSTFWILTLFLYAKYTERKNRLLYLLAISTFILGLMSKQMLVSVPFILLLLDYWPLQRFSIDSCVGLPKQLISKEFKSILLEKVPFLLLAVTASIITMISQQKAITPILNSTISERFANASVSYFQYIRKVFWPNDLAVFYPFPESMQITGATISALFLIAITTVAIKLRTRYPVIFVGWFWYLISLIPVIGIVRVGLQSMADRYTYIPAIGIFMIIIWSFSDLTRNLPRRAVVLSLISAVSLIMLSASAWQQASYWKNSMTLFTHTFNVTKNNYIALCGIGRALEREGKLDEALQKFDEAVDAAPWYEYAKTHQGIIMMNRGRVDAAVFKYNEAILQNPTTVPGHINLGILMALQGNLDEAIKNFKIALDFDPRSAAANYNMGFTLFQLGKHEEAIGYYLKALDTDPTDHECHNNLGIALTSLGRHDEAIRHFRESLRFKPNFADARDNLALALQKLGNSVQH